MEKLLELFLNYKELYLATIGCIGFIFYLNYKSKLIDLDKTNLIKEEPKKELNVCEKLKEYDAIEEYLNRRLEKIYNQFIFKTMLFTLKKFTSLAESTKNELRIEFIKYVEFQLNEEEKNIFKTRYTFEQFKFIITNYFNIKTTKLELLVIQKIDMEEKEFTDQKLITSLFNDVSNRDISEILNTLNETTQNK